MKRTSLQFPQNLSLKIREESGKRSGWSVSKGFYGNGMLVLTGVPAAFLYKLLGGYCTDVIPSIGLF